jgi:hypothetical protein
LAREGNGRVKVGLGMARVGPGRAKVGSAGLGEAIQGKARQVWVRQGKFR